MLAALLVAVALVTGPAQAGTSTVGAAGIGDPYYPTYGNGGYDVSHYGIHVAYSPSTRRLSGTTVVTARATQSLTRFDLDFVLPVSEVQVNGQEATFESRPHELVVTPATPLAPGAAMEVYVRYAGVPSQVTSEGIHPWITTADGALAVGEPEMAAWWFPSNDHPLDKATYDVRVTTAPGVEAVGNGRLLSSSLSGSHRVWHWRENRPMASYLAFFAVGQFRLSRSTSPSGLPVLTAVTTRGGVRASRAAHDLARTAEVIAFESRLWGPYPFEAEGGVAPASDFGFSLENQTRPVYGSGAWSNGSNLYVVVHELAHQWYGDSVSLRRWSEIWLNEGFATFTTWMYSERHGGGSAAALFAHVYSRHSASDPYWQLLIGNPGAHREFHQAVYSRGAMTLQALRTRVGNAHFFAIMRDWAAEHRYGHGSIPQFVALAQRISGQHLTGLFHTWLFTPSRPAPTRANGFPAHFTARSAARTLPSWRKLQRVIDLTSSGQLR